jgi:hypothetical protein
MEIMKLEVTSYDSDQSMITLEMDEEAKQWILDRGFNEILKDAIKNSQKPEEAQYYQPGQDPQT